MRMYNRRTSRLGSKPGLLPQLIGLSHVRPRHGDWSLRRNDRAGPPLPAGPPRGDNMIRFRVLGPVSVGTGPHSAVSLKGAGRRRLLATLLAYHNQPVSTARLIDAVWQADTPRNPVAALSTLVSRLRSDLGTLHRERILTETTGYSLRVEPGELDMELFERTFSEARSTMTASSERSLELFEQSLELWQGNAFDGAQDIPMLRSFVTRIEGMRLSCYESQGQILVALGRFNEAIAMLEPHVAAHPTREEALAHLMRALYGAGRHSDAVDAAATYRKHIADELGLDPSRELRLLEEQILRHELRLDLAAVDQAAGGDGRRDEEAVPARASRPPRPRSSFRGRDHDVHLVAEMLHDHPMVSLVGVGGVGKTRLSLEVAHAIGDEFPDGVLVAELAKASGGPEVECLLAEVAQLRSDYQGPLRDRLVEELSRRRSLLIIDNCEHVADHVAPVIDDLLARSTELRLLTTSRVRLGLQAEHVWPVEPLRLPESADDMDAPSLLVMRDRALAVDPHLRFTPANRVAAAELCRQVDGLPLALEIVAARLSSRTPAEVLSDLDSRYEQPSAARRVVAKRHSSLFEVVTWSVDLLDAEEAALFRQLSVFPGDFDLAAVCAVVDIGLPDDEVARRLDSLVDWSLVRRTTGGYGSRYHLLNTLRQYGRQDLRGTEEAALLAERHAVWYESVAERADRDRAALKDWIGVLDLELANLRAARQHRIVTGEVRSLVALSGSLHHYAFHAMRPELFQWAEEALALATGDGDTADQGAALGTVALWAWRCGDAATAENVTTRAVEVCSRFNDPRISFSLDVQGDLAFVDGCYADAATMYRRVVDIATSVDDHYAAVLSTGCWAVATASAGAITEAQRIVSQVDHLVERATSADLRAMSAVVRGQILDHAGEHDEARRYFWRGVDLSEGSASRYVTSIAWMAAAKAEAKAGVPEKSADLYRRLLARWNPDETVALAIALRGVSELLVSVGRHHEAAVVAGGLPPTPISLIFTGLSEQFGETVRTLRSALGDEDYARAAGEGHAMTRRRLLEFVQDLLVALSAH